MKKRFLTILLASLVACIAVSLFGCGKTVEFKVDFMVDGSVYASVSTSGDEVIKMPNDPEKSGYVFDGWYWDEGTWQKPFTANSLLNEPLSSNMSVYAKWKGDKLTFKTLTVNEDNTVYGKVSNSQTTFSFLNEIEIVGKATFVVSTDIYGINQIPTKTVPLEIGDNTFYVTETIGNSIKLYTVTVRRRPFYTVTFNTNNGTFVGNQTIEEDSFATEPTTTRTGYTFTGWDYDFAKPITKNTTITAGWSANTDTKYKVEYYQQNIENDDYTLYESVELKGTTDTTVVAEQKSYEHFTLDSDKSNFEGNIAGNGSLILKLYYTRDKHAVIININDTTFETIKQINETYKYGTELTLNIATNLGYSFIGWYQNETLISSETKYKFTLKKDIMLSLIWAVDEQMNNFNFESTADICIITGVKDKTITSVVIPEYITNIGNSAFSGCGKLTNIHISSIESWCKITGIDNLMRYGSSNKKLYINGEEITELIIPDNVKSIEPYAFAGFSRITSVIIGNGADSVGEYAFCSCEDLTNVTIGKGVINIGEYAFAVCSDLTSVIIGNSVKSIGKGAFYSCSKLSNVTIGNNVVSIGEGAFNKCIGLTTVSIPDSVIKIEFGAFDGCSGLTSVIIGNSVKNIGKGAFNKCTGLTTVSIPDSVINIELAAFSGCSGLTSVIIGNGVASIEDGAFYNCNGITKIEWNAENCIKSGSSSSEYPNVFDGCANVETVIIGEKVKTIPNYAFAGCNGLTNININSIESWCKIDGLDNLMKYGSSNKMLYIKGEEITEIVVPNSVTSIKPYAFYGCIRLTSVTIHNNITSIGDHTFYGCSGLTSITIPDKAISIGDYSFSDCSGLINVTILNPVTNIGKWAFYCCNSLKNIIYKGTISEWGKIAPSKYYRSIPSGCVIHCTDGDIEISE